MKILFMVMRFYGYELDIKNAFMESGYQVDLLYDKPKYHVHPRLIRESRKEKINRSYQIREINKRINNQYDYVFIIGGNYISSDVISYIKNTHPESKFILYLWDDIARISTFNDNKKYFDYILSFDRNDCKKYGFSFLPLFYTKDFSLSFNTNKKFDIYGSYSNHSDRISIMNKISTKYSNRIIYFYVYITKLTYLIYKIKGRMADKSITYSYKILSKNENAQIMKASRCILDIQHPSQTGLTMRTIEALGCGNKLITTNTDICNYDFYNPNNICVIDRNNPVIPENFFDTEYEPLPDLIYKKYSIFNWVNEIVKVEENNER